MKEEFCPIIHNNNRTKQSKTRIYKNSGKNKTWERASTSQSALEMMRIVWFLRLNNFIRNIVVYAMSLNCSRKIVKIVNIFKIAFQISEVSKFSMGPLLRLKTSNGAEAPPSPPLAPKWPLQKAHHPLLERFLGRERNNRSTLKIFLLESICWYYSSLIGITTRSISV